MTNKKIRYKPVQEEILEIAGAHGNNPEAALEVLREIQTLRGELSTEDLKDAARAVGIPAHQSYGAATFYSLMSLEPKENVVRVCNGTACWLKRAAQTRVAFEEAGGEGWHVEHTSCLGMCDRAPAVLINGEQAGPIPPEKAKDVLEGYRGKPTEYGTPREGEVRAMMALAGKIDPDSVQDALAKGVYDGLEKALGMKPSEVIAEAGKAGLQGRGGAGFPTARKWEFVANEKNAPKYIICNADESEPLVFKDRVLIDSNPHQILAGMAIAGYATGANEGWIYIRGEYESQAKRLENAIAQAEAENRLGDDIRGSGFDFKIHVHRGAGAYICGEETALIESLEGKRGEPRLRPPYPPQAGFRGQPTAVNNVETLAGASVILQKGAEWWLSRSEYETPGTKLYMILGHVKNPGLFEAPFGITLREAIEQFGGGMRAGSDFHFALTGGAAGTIVDGSKLDVALDYASHRAGISLGAGAFLVVDQSVSPVAFLREELRFFAAESCGKCTPCRVGTWRAFKILERMAAGNGKSGDVAELKSLAKQLTEASFCGLGQSVGIPMNSAMEAFAADFEQAENGGDA
jgi:NADH:ubiquinone oxidoreductase subunit F (NADH-binding)/NADH:ubiquinone oxidoreductase subunit E